MRLSAERGDPGYMIATLNPRAKVFFEGAELRFVITADEEKRHLKAYSLDPDGKPLVSPDGTHLLTRELFGHVRIELTPPIMSQGVAPPPLHKLRRS